ncbi:MAG TPA: DUF72 domain-containing protein [Archangium sp.]|uniref:DUF72 domain-containing protein n=1 Tax=Archangium sp. TaxID=1872627 RepID=UPI002E32A561|nr:DUF72 domain-containing protein [Archangium sp.]HEX5750321.1 DUF72 domain-containing protein [Archangium sp.]
MRAPGAREGGSAHASGMRAIHLGTSGYVYKHWKGLFYPTGLPASRWLPYFARWREQTPGGFKFACKGSRYLTHMKRLTDVGEGLERYFSVILRLGSKLGPVLWQLPPQMKKPDPERLDRFLAALPRGVQYVVEFRDAAWYHAEVLEVLDRRGAAVCEHDLVPVPPPRLTGGLFDLAELLGRVKVYPPPDMRRPSETEESRTA